MGRKPCCEKEGVNRGAWTPHEDRILVSYIKTHGEGKWMTLPKIAGLKRCGKSCRLRWLNYLRPDIKRGNISGDEDDLIIRLHKLLGNRWSLIAGRLPGRTDNEIKNYWNTNLSKRVHGQPPQQVKPMPSAKSKGKNPVTEPAKIDPSPPEAPTEAQVIRTKATRCKRAFFHLDQHHINYPQRQDPVVNLGRNGSFNHVSMDVDSTVRALEFDVGEGIQVGDHSMREDAISTSLGVPSYDPAPLGELALEDWLTSECFDLEPEVTVDFQSLASFLLNND